MSANAYIQVNYENFSIFKPLKNKANSNPITPSVKLGAKREFWFRQIRQFYRTVEKTGILCEFCALCGIIIKR